MRKRVFAISLALTLAGCASAHRTAATGSPVPALAPLRACETRELTVDGTDVVVAANADGTAASIEVVGARSAAARNEVLRAVRGAFGPARRDPEAIAHQSKWGLVTWTDRCGHPVAGASAKPPA